LLEGPSGKNRTSDKKKLPIRKNFRYEKTSGKEELWNILFGMM